MSKSRWVATDFIANSTKPSGYDAGEIVDFIGWSASGDGGSAQWKATGNVIAASQTPAMLGTAKCSDASGNEFELIYSNATLANEINLASIGGNFDGATDQLSVINSAINSLKSLGGGVLNLPAGTGVISDEVTIEASNIIMKGVGGDINHQGPQGLLASTSLTWAGPAGGVMIRVKSTEGAANQKFSGCGVSKLFLRGGAGLTAGYGLLIESQDKGVYEDLHFNEFTGACIKLDSPIDLIDPSDPQRNRFFNCSGVCITLSGAFVELAGSEALSANTSNNTFYNMSCIIRDGGGYILRNSDNNTFYRCGCFRNPGGTGNAIEAHGSNTGGGVARNNLFIHFSSANVPIVGFGTETYSSPSRDNKIMFSDKDNGTPEPSVGSGASFWVDTSSHSYKNPAISSAAFGSTLTKAESTRDRRDGETIRVSNENNKHITLESGDQNSEWIVSVDDPTGDARILRNSGSGRLLLNQELRLTSQSSETSAVAGGATALPANPAGYLNVEINGSSRLIPYYAKT